MSFLDDIKAGTSTLVDVAKDAASIRSVWQPQSTVVNSQTNVPLAVNAAQVATAQAQGNTGGNVPAAAQWSANSVSKAITGLGGSQPVLLIGLAVVLVVVLVAMRH